ncbi:MAG: ATP-binding cassette domain-containing protein [Acidimicrobiales bacterium]|nr:ATP-binding cassette domain-containing protein [Acidimicrobiales bacterium]
MGRVLLQGVSKRFGDTVAAADVSLDIADGEFLVLLGPSGCGKSTVLRMIAGLEEPTSGTIAIGDRVVNDVDPKDRDVAMVFQTYALYPHLTVRGNVGMALKTRHLTSAEREHRVRESLEALDLDELADRKPGALSGGQRQRVALARALVRQPAVYLMDEPLSNLDAKLRIETRAELLELHQRLAATIVYVTHDQVEAMTLGSRVAILEGGALQQVGAAQEVYERPANLFVARFIGSPPMNTVAGRVVSLDGGLALAVPGGTVPLPEAHAAVVQAAGLDAAVLGVRPEHLAVGDGPLPATVLHVEDLGSEQHLLCRLDDGSATVVRMAAAATVPAVGERVSLTADPAHVHLFDPVTTRRLEVPAAVPAAVAAAVVAEAEAPVLLPPSVPRARRVGRRAREALLGYALLVPSMLVFGVFVFYPFAKTVQLSFTKSDPFRAGVSTWVGIDQYRDVLSSADFQNSLKVTVLFALLTVPVGLAAGLGLAVMANQHLRGIGAFRTIFSSTVATSVAVASLMFLTLLNPQIGMVNYLLGRTGANAIDPLNDPQWALVAVAAVTVWQNLGVTFILMLAGLQAIPEELYEAADVDGAGGWSRFVNVTVPMVSPTLLFAFVVLSINAFQSFGQIDLLTQGGPLGRTDVIVYSIYTTAFKDLNDARAAVLAVVLFSFVLVLTMVQLRMLERRVHYGR